MRINGAGVTLMALFNRRTQKQSTLPEVERYYDAEKRDRAGMAWVMAIASILAIVAVLVGLFFSGRWIYRSLTKDDTKKPVATKTNTTAGQNNTSDTEAEDDGSAADTPAPSTQTPAPSAGSNSTGSTQTPPANTSATNSAQSTTQLANTGPASVVPAFILATLLGILVYRFKAARSN